MSAPFIETHCGESFHWFLYTPSGVKAFHSDDNECETSEFRLPLKDEATRCGSCGGSGCVRCEEA